MVTKVSGLFLFVLLTVNFVSGQSHNYWTRSFSEESSLLSGAVVGGGGGPSAIYYNPATISEIRESKLTFNTSLFSFNAFSINNALGDGIDMKWLTFQVEPRFFSFMIKPKKRPGVRIEFAFLNSENYSIDMAESVNKDIDILTQIPGNERYFAKLNYRNKYRDDWLGMGMSWTINDHLFVGASMFVTVKTVKFSYDLNIQAYPVDSVSGIQPGEYYTASFHEEDYVKYNDYRLLWKLGIMYKRERYSIGACLTTPSLGGIYSDGKRISRIRQQSEIRSPETGEPLPDYFIGDYQEKRAMDVNHKSPFSIAAGLTLRSLGENRVLYTTVEYFGSLDPYRLITADENNNIFTSTVTGSINMNEWLTVVSGADPVFNAAIGYRWRIHDELLLMTGFRTDFNYLKDFDYGALSKLYNIKTLAVDNYHFSGGLSWKVLGQDVITGIQYTLGVERNQKQFINLSDPVEYNQAEQVPLQGTRNDNMDSFLNSLSLYLGATFNFGTR